MWKVRLVLRVHGTGVALGASPGGAGRTVAGGDGMTCIGLCWIGRALKDWEGECVLNEPPTAAGKVLERKDPSVHVSSVQTCKEFL